MAAAVTTRRAAASGSVVPAFSLTGGACRCTGTPSLSLSRSLCLPSHRGAEGRDIGVRKGRRGRKGSDERPLGCQADPDGQH